MNNIFLKNKLYEIISPKLQRTGTLKEKELQIVLSNVLHHDFGIKRIYHEPNYRYHDLKRGYFSDIDIDHCQDVERKQKAKRCDIRLASPPAWVELKLNAKPDPKDIGHLFGTGNPYFTSSEDRYSLNFWTNGKKIDKIENEVHRVLQSIKTAPDTNTKLIQIKDEMTVVVIYKLGQK